MRSRSSLLSCFLLLAAVVSSPGARVAQAAVGSGSIHGRVAGPDGQPMSGVAVELRNDITGFKADTTTSADGTFQFFNVPFNPYEIHVEAQGFETVHRTTDVRSAMPLDVPVTLKLATLSEKVTVSAEGDGGPARDRHVDVPRGHRQVVHRKDAGHGLVAGHGGAGHGHPRVRQGRERPLSLPGRPQPGPVRHRRPDHLGPDRHHVLELDRPGHRPVDGGHLRQRPRRVRREDRLGRQPRHEVGPRDALSRGRLRWRRASTRRTKEGWRWVEARETSRPSGR